MEALFILFIWIIISWIVGAAANSRGRSAIAWFLLALVVSPIIAVLLLIAFAPVKRRRQSIYLDDLEAYDDELRKNIRRARHQEPKF
jgi:uncharacterized membrane protein YhdT